MKDLLLDIQTNLEQLYLLVKSGVYKNEDLLCKFDEISLRIEDKVKEEEEKVYVVYGYYEDKKSLMGIYKSEDAARRFIEEQKLYTEFENFYIEEEYIMED